MDKSLLLAHPGGYGCLGKPDGTFFGEKGAGEKIETEYAVRLTATAWQKIFRLTHIVQPVPCPSSLSLMMQGMGNTPAVKHTVHGQGPLKVDPSLRKYS